MLVAPIFATLLLAFVLVSRRLEGSPVSPALVFAAGGVVTGLAGGAELNPRDLAGTSGEVVRVVAELALALVLFAGASSIGLRRAAAERRLPDRLLGVGLPLTILAGTLAAVLLLGGLEFWLCVLVAALLAPTDAALAAPVVTDERVPGPVRRSLDIEAGLNDGVCVPVVTFALAAAVSVEGSPTTALWREALVTIGGGVLVGAIAGWGGGALLGLAERRDSMAADARPFAAAALALATFFIADEVGASGFIAAFVAGLVAARALGERQRSLVRFSERDGALLSFAVFFAFGILAAGVLGDVSAAEVLYAVLSLTLVRMAPVALALAATGLRHPSFAFMGWFGPRGIATIALLLVAVGEEPDLAGLDVVIRTVTATVLLSIVLHGVSAPALVARYGAWSAALPAGAAETAEPSAAARPTRS